MQNVCPITDKRMNEQVARMNAFVTFSLVLLFIVFGFRYAIYFLLVDFIIRGFVDGRYSLLSFLNIRIASALKISPKIINAGPKIFAAQVGVLFTLLITLGIILNYPYFALTLAVVLAFFSFLEMAFGICVACKIYPFIRRS